MGPLGRVVWVAILPTFGVLEVSTACDSRSDDPNGRVGTDAGNTHASAGRTSNQGGSESSNGVSGASGEMSGASGGVGGTNGGASGSANGGVAGASELVPTEYSLAMARAAVVIGSCLPDDGVNRNALRLWNNPNSPRFWDRFGMQARCLAATNQGCAALESCLGLTLTSPIGSACARACSGTVFSGCGDGARYTIDCAKLGLACDVNAVCSNTPSAPCERTTTERTCSADGEPIFCDDDAIFRGPRCEDFGLRCSDGYCVGAGEVCTGRSLDDQGGVYFDGTACSAGKLQACVGDHVTERDCSLISPEFSCQEVDGEPFCGLGSECLPALDASNYGNFDARCDGSTLVFCNAGRLEHVDCTTLGFTGCNDTEQAVCLP